jgi:hypothetical protein
LEQEELELRSGLESAALAFMSRTTGLVQPSVAQAAQQLAACALTARAAVCSWQAAGAAAGEQLLQQQQQQ